MIRPLRVLAAALLCAGTLSAAADPVTYPVPAGSRWHLYSVATGGIVPPAPPAVDRPWPRDDGGPLQGIDPATYPYRWLMIGHREPAADSYDPETHDLTTTHLIELDPAPSILGRYVAERSLVLRSPDEIDAGIRSQYAACLNGVGSRVEVGALLLGAAALDRTDDLALPTDVAPVVAAWREAVTGYIRACMTRRDALLAETQAMRERLAAGQPAGPTPLLRTGWPTPPSPPPAS